MEENPATSATVSPHVYTRAELYELVWSRPMIELAKEFGLSDNGLRKKCKKLNIPLPPQGYWLQSQHGTPEHRPPLPAHEGPNTVEIRKEALSTVGISSEEGSDPEEVQKQIEFEQIPENHISVLATLSTPHPLISQFKAAKRDGRSSGSDRSAIIPMRSEYLDIRVTPGSLDRALRIASALLKAADKRGMKVSIIKEDSPYSNSSKQFTAAVVMGENVQFYIKETVKQKVIEYDSKSKSSSDFWSRPKYEHIPTGMLTLSIQERADGRHRRNWTDGTRQNIENYLNDFMVALVRTAVCKRNDRLERQRRERERIELEIRRYEEEKRRKEEAARLEELVQEATDWQTSLLIRNYVEAVKVARPEDVIDTNSELYRWMAWALKQADKLDPLGSEDE